MRSIRSAYGRAASADCCARRSLAAATIFIAEVICIVDPTDVILDLISFKFGIK